MNIQLNRNHVLVCSTLGLLAFAAYRGYCRQGRRPAPQPAAPHYIQTWEAEGGGVPVDAGRTTAQMPPKLPGEEEGELRGALGLSPLGATIPPV